MNNNYLAMIEYPVGHPILPGLFDPHIPNNPALWAVFLGHHPGQTVTDDRQHPSQCLLHTKALLTYASRGISREFLAMTIELYRQVEPVWLVRAKEDPPAPAGYKLVPRLEFYDYDPRSLVRGNINNQVPAGFSLRRIDMELLKRCKWRDDMAFYSGSLKNFLRHDLGICLMHGDEIIVEAYASALGDPYAEIGAITHEPHRGKGYALITVVNLIEMLEARGYHAYWSCNVDNLASVQLARKLGFRVELPYEIFEYEAKS